jgi:Fic family protein
MAYFDEFKKLLQVDVEQQLNALETIPFSTDNFKFYITNSAVHSSNIEGNTINFDTYLKSKEHNLHLKTKEFKEIDELILAYEFAKENKLNLKNLLFAHELITTSILKKKERGKIRQVQVGVRSEGRLIYLAIEPEYVKEELEKLFEDILFLQQQTLTVEQIFYFASFIHLCFVYIHPFVDGNGRATRLLEKWFLSTMLSAHVWSITSEKYYWNNRQDYYKNLQNGVNYYEINYQKSTPFLLMLPNALLSKI